ncbi:FAD-dependent monooxygenase [Arthrobacter sp. NPDC058127]|uniref:FAD-dependent monooxygenase n=1 Tax=Arthrobacter sp. NPDC058127 TaxID=3346351 RepID=UPI0036EA0996
MEHATQATGRVIVIGAGPVGLSVAVEIGLRGIPVTIVDPVVDLSERLHPRARIVNLRSTEHFRRWGVADTVREHSAFGPTWPTQVQFRTSLAGYKIAAFGDAFFTAPTDTALYPEPAIQIRQSDVEFGIRERLAGLPNVETLYGYEALEVSQDEDSVHVHARSRDGEERHLTGAYIVGGDGGRSIVRRAFGFKMIGKTAISQNVQILFESKDLYTALNLEPAMQYWCLNDEFPGFVQTTSPDGEFILSLHKLKDVNAFTTEQAERAVRIAIGSDVPFRIIGLDPWVIHARIAEAYRRGRAFVVGDAARQHSTYGAHGMNLGLSDAADIGWKLAAVLQGWAPEALLDTFTAERRPIGVGVLEEATRSFSKSAVDLVVPGISEPGEAGDAVRAALSAVILKEKAPQFRHIGTQLGYSYADSPLIISDGTTGPERTPNSYTPSAVPGYLAPHAWLADGTSLYDNFGQWFTVLDFGQGQAENLDALVEAAEKDQVPVTVLRRPSQELEALYGARFAIIRPDQHVAWRGDVLPLASLWATVTGHVLQPSAAAAPAN